MPSLGDAPVGDFRPIRPDDAVDEGDDDVRIAGGGVPVTVQADDQSPKTGSESGVLQRMITAVLGGHLIKDGFACAAPRKARRARSYSSEEHPGGSAQLRWLKSMEAAEEKM